MDKVTTDEMTSKETEMKGRPELPEWGTG